MPLVVLELYTNFCNTKYVPKPNLVEQFKNIQHCNTITNSIIKDCLFKSEQNCFHWQTTWLQINECILYFNGRNIPLRNFKWYRKMLSKEAETSRIFSRNLAIMWILSQHGFRQQANFHYLLGMNIVYFTRFDKSYFVIYYLCLFLLKLQHFFIYVSFHKCLLLRNKSNVLFLFTNDIFI